MQPETNLTKDYSADRFKNSVAKGDKGKLCRCDNLDEAKAINPQEKIKVLQLRD